LQASNGHAQDMGTIKSIRISYLLSLAHTRARVDSVPEEALGGCYFAANIILWPCGIICEKGCGPLLVWPHRGGHPIMVPSR